MENRIIKDKTDLIELLSNTYTGYIWMVEHQKPIIHTKEELKIEELEYRENPHNKIQEAYLTDGAYSIHIKNIDGKEKVFVLKYTDFDKEDKYKKKELKFPSHIVGIKNLIFDQVYELKESEISKGFHSWQPIVRLFKGIE